MQLFIYDSDPQGCGGRDFEIAIDQFAILFFLCLIFEKRFSIYLCRTFDENRAFGYFLLVLPVRFYFLSLFQFIKLLEI
jgi:hypothetical protein